MPRIEPGENSKIGKKQLDGAPWTHLRVTLVLDETARFASPNTDVPGARHFLDIPHVVTLGGSGVEGEKKEERDQGKNRKDR